MFYLRTLGQLSLHESGPDGPVLLSRSKPLALLALLATFPRGAARRDYAAALLWPGVGRTRALRSLRQALFYLSRRIGERVVRADESMLVLDSGRIGCDLWEFDAAIEGGDYGRAVGLYGGPFVAGFDHKLGAELDRWIEARNEEIRAALEVAYVRVVEACLEAADFDGATRHARRYADLNPLDEDAQLTLIHTLVAAGDKVGALRAYEGYRALLEKELGGSASDELQSAVGEVQETLLRGVARGAPDVVRRAADTSRDGSRRRTFRTVAMAVAATATIAAAAFAGWSFRGATVVPVDRLDLLQARLYAWISQDGAHEPVELRVDGGELLVVRRLEFEPGRDIPSPDGRRIAFYVHSAEGYDLAVRDAHTGATRRLTSSLADEKPLGWSPDGRYILYRSGHPTNGGRDYQVRLATWDLKTGEPRVFGSWLGTPNFHAAWSPDGTRIVSTGTGKGRGVLGIVDSDGRRARALFSHDGAVIWATWSPDGRWIAFATRDSTGTALRLIAPDGSGRRSLLTGDIVGPPVWLSPTVMACVVRSQGYGEIRLIDIYTGESRGLVQAVNVRALSAESPGPPTSWVARLAITPRLSLVTPGETLRLRVVPTDTAGTRVPLPDELIRWRVSDPSLARVSESGKLHVLRRGRFQVFASAAGWCADTLEVESRPLVARDVEPAFTEDWTRGLEPSRWISFGQPRPYTRPSGGPQDGGVFVSNGDKNYHSGAVTRQAFPLGSGLTVEVWGRMPFSGKHYELFAITLYSELPSNPTDWDQGVPVPVLSVMVNGHRTTTNTWVLAAADPNLRAPLPPDPGRWHRYALQIDTDARATLLVDGDVLWRSSAPVVADLGRAVHVALGTNSYQNEILHGPLAVYAGELYVHSETVH